MAENAYVRKAGGRNEGDHVIVFDSHGQKHNGIVTRIHTAYGMSPEEHREKYSAWPCINVVFVSDDPERTDSYGQQIERYSSFSHRAPGMPNGMNFLWPDEEK
jgi:hypothetical protein